MKKILLLFTLLLGILYLPAQLPNGSTCPDFTGVDINGNSHNLYTLLDQGKTVVVDVSATWCGPCWSYHQTHALDSVWAKYGPNGTDEMFVMWVEGDAQTGMQDLQGQTGSSQGDWTAGTTYPIVDDHTISNLLQVAGFPTIYVICPSREINEIGWGSADEATLYSMVCPAAIQGTDLGASALSSAPAYCQSGSYTPVVSMQNLGSDPITSATIETYLNGNLANTDTWTGNLSTYQMEQVTLTTLNGLMGSPALTFKVVVPNDQVATNDEVNATLAASNLATESTINIVIQPDNYPGETGWNLYDGSGNLIDSRTAGDYTSQALQTHTIQLGSGIDCFTFEITDTYGDGICCSYGNGYYEIQDASNNNAVISGGQFQAAETNSFQNTTLVNVDGQLENTISVYPTVSEGRVKVEMNHSAAGPWTVALRNQLGQVLQQHAVESQGTFDFDFSKYAAGIYTLQFQNGNNVEVKKIVLR